MAESGTISLADHLSQTKDLQAENADLKQKLEAAVSDHQSAASEAVELKTEISEVKTKLTEAQEALTGEQSAHAATKEQAKADLEALRQEQAEQLPGLIKEGVTQALADQGREPVDPKALDGSGNMRELTDEQVRELSPQDRAEFFADVHAGKARLL
tara:strand:+ start:324 stop:794 length:471 start_codon:yes stop_codon:yes gene_type:complete